MKICIGDETDAFFLWQSIILIYQFLTRLFCLSVRVKYARIHVFTDLNFPLKAQSLDSVLMQEKFRSEKKNRILA